MIVPVVTSRAVLGDPLRERAVTCWHFCRPDAPTPARINADTVAIVAGSLLANAYDGFEAAFRAAA